MPRKSPIKVLADALRVLAVLVLRGKSWTFFGEGERRVEIIRETSEKTWHGNASKRPVQV